MKGKEPSRNQPTEEAAHKKRKHLEPDSVLHQSFLLYQRELDVRNEKHERLVKISRDITIQSKKVIFGLLRKEDDVDVVVREAEEKISSIVELISKVAEEVKNEDTYKFLRAFRPGFQEFIEAISLLHFIKDKEIISYEDAVSSYFHFDENNDTLLTYLDYLLGIADLTGELMRMAINSIGDHGLDRLYEICAVLQTMYHQFAKLSNLGYEMNQKIKVMKNSVAKVEKACYTLKIRGSEVPDCMLQDLITDAGQND